MNFLAHIFLSGDDELLKIGNFMADGIRGKKYEDYPVTIQKGILLHRFIDSYTDNHPVFKKSTQRLHANYHHYAGVIVDMFYDHFLAKNWSQYCSQALENYAADFYDALERNYEILTPRVQNMLPYMIKNNWLYNYQTIAGLQVILSQMDSRTQNQSKMGLATQELTMFYTEFESEFRLVFKDLQDQVSIKIKQL